MTKSRRTKRSVPFTLALMALAKAAEAQSGVGIQHLTGESGGKAQSFDLPDGTNIKWTEFFNSPSSHVSVGRSDINGALMPKDKLSYTDVFYIADGSAVFVDGQHRKHHAHKGEILLLPRGMELEGHDLNHYVHFAASFEAQPDDKSNGPLEVRALHPERLKSADFSVEGASMRHVYYEGMGGVVVRAWQSTQADIATEYSPSPWSELFFVVSGSGSITPQGGAEEILSPGEVFFIPKGAVFKFTAHKLRKLAIVFDQSPVTTSR